MGLSWWDVGSTANYYCSIYRNFEIMNSNTIRIFAIRSAVGCGEVACLLVALAILFFCTTSHAQSSSSNLAKLETFLKSKDSNGNGSIEPEEMSNNTKGFLSKMGLNTDKAIKISKAIKKAGGKSDDSGKPSPKKREQAKLKVPGFGVEKKSGTVRSFSTSGNSTSKTEKTYSENILERTQWALDRYDRNQDGVLDESEMRRGRWSPRPSVSDLNGDGVLSKQELNERYLAREKASSSDSRGEGRGDRSDSDGDSNRDREKDSRLIRPTQTGSNSSKPKLSDRLKYHKYAQSQLNSYDRNKDGRLDEDEMEKMKRLPEGADANEDGFVSQIELANSLRAADQKNNSSSATNRRTYPKTRSPSRKTTSSKGRSNKSKGSSLGKLDANGDNQIQMHEFSDKWDEDVVAEYYEADKNGDGVITAAEWSNR